MQTQKYGHQNGLCQWAHLLSKRIEGENDAWVLMYLIFSLWCCQGLAMSINQRSQEWSGGFLHAVFSRFQYLLPSLALWEQHLRKLKIIKLNDLSKFMALNNRLENWDQASWIPTCVLPTALHYDNVSIKKVSLDSSLTFSDIFVRYHH